MAGQPNAAVLHGRHVGGDGNNQCMFMCVCVCVCVCVLIEGIRAGMPSIKVRGGAA